MDKLLIDGEAIPFAASPNNGPRPAGVEPSLIVLHSTGGRYRGAVDWLRSPASNASAHVVVSREGGMTQIVPFSRAAWHAGVSEWHGKKGVNAFSIGIEMEHIDGQQDWPTDQLTAVAALCRALMAKYDIPLDAIVGHAQVARPAGRKVDPVNFPWGVFRTLLNGHTSPTPSLVLPDGRVPGRMIQNQLYVPAREVCEALGMEARWDGQAKELRISGGKEARP